jgi:hypothetical protein
MGNDIKLIIQILPPIAVYNPVMRIKIKAEANKPTPRDAWRMTAPAHKVVEVFAKMYKKRERNVRCRWIRAEWKRKKRYCGIVLIRDA